MCEIKLTTSLYRTVAVFLIITALSALILSPLREESFSPTSDEGYYRLYAETICLDGLDGFPKLIRWHADDENLQKFPIPSRIGHILPIALMAKIYGPTFSTLGLFSLICFLLFILISFYFSRKHFGEDTALLTTVLLCSSPLLLMASRRALMDSHLNLVWSLCIWLFLDFLSNKRKSTYIVLLVSFTYAMLIKESSLALLVFFIIFALIHKFFYRKELPWPYVAGIILGPLMVASVIYLVILGGIENVKIALGTMKRAHFDSSFRNAYAYQYCSGAWFRYIIDFLCLSPLTLLFFAGYFFHLLLIRKWKWEITYFMVFFMTIFTQFSFLDHDKNIRHIMSLEVVLCLFTVLFLYEVLSFLKGLSRDRCLLVIVIAIFSINYSWFIGLFVSGNLLDPISHYLLIARQIVPWCFP